MKPEHTKLNIGCGYKKLNDHWNVDNQPGCNPDQVLDLEVTPWPYEDDFFEKIHADNIMEHLGQDPKVFMNIIKEMYRVSKNGAEWYICVPHHRCDLFWDDPTHVRALSAKTFKLFDQSYNFKCIKDEVADSTLGLYNNLDLEVYDVKYNLLDYWINLQQHGMLGPAQMEIKMNTMSNTVGTVDIFVRVHKPGRFMDWYNKKA